MEDMLIYQKAQKIVCTLFRERFYFSFKNGDRQVELQMWPLLFYLQKPTKLYFSLHGSKKTKFAGELYQKSAWHCKRGNRWTAQVITIKGKTKTRKSRHCSAPEVGMMFNMMFLFSRLFGIDRDLMPPLIKSIERRHSLSLHSAEEIL